MGHGSWVIELMKTPGGAAAVSACAALSGAGLTARVQRNNHRDTYAERQEDKVRDAVADVLGSRWTWPHALMQLGATVAAADRSTAEGNEAFKAACQVVLGEFFTACLDLTRNVERVRLLTRNVKIHTALVRIDELIRIGRRVAEQEGQPHSDR